MKLVINQNEKRFIDVQNETISGVLISIDTDLDIDEYNLLEKIAINDISIYLTQDGKKTSVIVPKLSLKDLHDVVFSNNRPLSERTFQIGRAFGLFKSYQLPFNFKTPLNLKAGQGLFIECDNKTLHLGASSVITIETIPTIGVQQFLPSFEMIELEATKSVHDLTLDKNVTKVVYLGNNNDVSPYDVEEITVKSDKLNTEYSDSLVYAQLLDTVEPDNFYAGTPINLIDTHAPLNNLRLKLKFSNAIAGRKLIVVREYVDAKIMSNFLAKKEEHQQENVKAIKSNVHTDCGCK